MENDLHVKKKSNKVPESGCTIIKRREGEGGRGRGRARRRESQEKEEGGNFSREKRGRNYVEQVTAAAVLALLSSSSVVRVRPSSRGRDRPPLFITFLFL